MKLGKKGFLASLGLILAGCMLSQPVYTETSEVAFQATPTATALDSTITLVPSYTPTAPPTLEPTITPTPLTLTPISTSTEIPTSSPTNIPVPKNCITPKSLMLHSNYGSERMEELADIIEDNNLTTITYEDLYDQYYLKGKCPLDNTILVSLDDLDTDYLVPELKRMVQVFLDHNLVLTLGVVTQKPGKQEIWDYYKYLQNQGIEISSHTVNHYNLPVLSQAELEYEIEESYNLICQNTIKCPYTIILPFGNGRHDSRVVQAAGNIGYFGIVSIAGENYFGGNTPHTFRRIPPDFSSQARTLNLLKNSFGDK